MNRSRRSSQSSSCAWKGRPERAPVRDNESMPKLICVDVDGTLVTERQETPDSAREAVRASIAAGHKLLLCTGRSLPEIYPYLWDLGFHGIIAGSGAFVKIGKTVVADRRMSSEDISYVTAIYRRYGAQWMWQGPEEFSVSEGFFGSFAGSPDAEGSPWHPYYKQILPFLTTEIPTSTSKGLFVLPHSLHLSYRELVEIIGPKYHIVSDSVEAKGGITGEILLAGLTKDVGMFAAAEHLGLDVKQTVAIGDSPNDVEILDAAGIGVAMGNATDAVKAHADFVTSSIEDDGLYRAFEALDLM